MSYNIHKWCCREAAGRQNHIGQEQEKQAKQKGRRLL